jgi:hypothetical protein
MEKRGQLNISFGMMFSIFLIVIFIFFAFKIIFAFVGTTKCLDITSTYTDLQKEIDRAKSSQTYTREYEIDFGSSVSKICLFDFNSSQKGDLNLPDVMVIGENSFLIFKKSNSCESLSRYQFKGINISKITQFQNPICFDNGDSTLIKKELYSGLVVLE